MQPFQPAIHGVRAVAPPYGMAKAPPVVGVRVPIAGHYITAAGVPVTKVQLGIHGAVPQAAAAVPQASAVPKGQGQHWNLPRFQPPNFESAEGVLPCPDSPCSSACSADGGTDNSALMAPLTARAGSAVAGRGWGGGAVGRRGVGSSHRALCHRLPRRVQEPILRQLDPLEGRGVRREDEGLPPRRPAERQARAHTPAHRQLCPHRGVGWAATGAAPPAGSGEPLCRGGCRCSCI